MSEVSMYDTLKSLPLFKGASDEQISQLAEKCRLDFSIYEPCEVIAALDSTSDTLKCLVSGQMEVRHPLFCGAVTVIEEAECGRFLGAERLFGISNVLRYEAKALTRCGTMEIGKQQYLELLASNHVFMLNFLNYLSCIGQRFEHIAFDSCIGSSISRLAMILECTSSRRSRNIRMTVDTSYDSDQCGLFLDKLHRDLTALEEAGTVSWESYGTLRVNDRERIFETALHKS